MARGDGKLYIRFVDVGQGDCSVIACPNGEIVIFDCGTSNFDDVNLQLIRDSIVDNKLFLYDNAAYGLNSLVVHALVLSHPDKDHYSQVPKIFYEYDSALRDTYFKAIYHSMDVSNYSVNGASYWLRGYYGTEAFKDATTKVFKKRKIFIGASKGKIEQLTFRDASKNLPHTILEGEFNRIKYRVDVLVAGYELARVYLIPDENKRNEASIVLRVQYGNDVIIIMGDATTDTESFMLQKYQGTSWLRAGTLRIGHHGSDGSSSAAFLTEVFKDNAGKPRPGKIVIHAKKDSGYKIPKQTVVDQCKFHAEVISAHDIGYFQTTDNGWVTETITRNIDVTGISGVIGAEFNGF